MTYRVGPGPDCDYPGLGALAEDNVLAPGDLVEITGTPAEGKTYTYDHKWEFPVAGSIDPITFRGISNANGDRPFFDGRGKSLEAPRAFFELYGSTTEGSPGDGAWVIENLEFQYCRNNDNDMNGSAIRNKNAASVTIRNCKIWNCAMGVMASDEAVDTIIEDCDIAFNGFGDGHSHNIYVMGTGWFRLRNSRVHDSTVGQNVKTRNRFVEIASNEIFFSRDGEIGIIQSGSGLPEDSGVTRQPGSNAIVADNLILTRKDRSGGNQAMVISFGLDENTCGRDGTLYLYGNRILTQSSSNQHIKLTGDMTRLKAGHNKFVGAGKTIIYEKDPALLIAGAHNWCEEDALVPIQFILPASYNYTMGEDFADAASPANRQVRQTPATPTGLRDWKEQGGLGVQWDAVPGAAFYRVWREKRVNKKGVEKTIWGGSTEPQYVDTFQHYDSQPGEQKEYAYTVVAVDAQGNQSEQSIAWVKEHGVPDGYPDAGEEGKLTVA